MRRRARDEAIHRVYDKAIRGQPILVRDRDRVIARIEPAGPAGGASGAEAEKVASLEQRGILRRARGPLSKKLLAGRPRIATDGVAGLLREREEGR